MTPVIETERLILRKPAARDWPVCEAFYSSPRSFGVGGPKDKGDAWRAFAMFVGHWDLLGFGLFAITLKGGPDVGIGLAGPFYPADWHYHEIGWHIWDASLEGKGIAYEAAMATRDYARQELDWSLIVSDIAHGNDRSMALAERMGAVLDPALKHPDGKPRLVHRHPEAAA